MSDALDKAEAAVADASRNTDVVAVAMAALEVAKLAAESAKQQPHTCGHDHKQQPEFNARKWWTIGGLVIVGGGIASALALAFALAAVAVAIAGTCATCCLLVLRSMWRASQNGH
ncbi:hypothetical protein DMH25_08195 [Streptomyces sp. WAC 01325]|uniref:hypothetical protein n=1 Tax=Streptomyces sp. WAC 01325 TaxID=2203202 RepID=UPI000F86EB59|nr:hypothetical protein [Streptomyces sp. WAC 01325]RSN13813.1 hypothetical protein DMH25_08195 [Streptomyces sp. WAC 01325]